MQNFFLFLLRHSTFLLFLLLEGVCLALIFNMNDYHRASFLSSSNAVHGKIYETTSSITHYFGLSDANEDLIRQNIGLMAQVDSLRYVIESMNQKRSNEGDTTTTLAGLLGREVVEREMHYRVGHIVKATCNHSRNMLTMDVGEVDGIQKDMAVVNGEGVVGMVSAVGRHYSIVLPIINTSTRISVKIKGSNHRGQLVWDGVSPRRANVIDIPEHATVAEGDTIVTSGASCFFPEGLTVGSVESIQPDANGGFLNISVRLATDYNSVYAVEILEDTTIPERMELENKATDE